MAAKELIQVPVILDTFKPMKDRSYKVTFETRALTGDELALLGNSFQGEGWLVFSPNQEINEADIPTEVADAGVKSPATRLRDRLYIYWQSTKGIDDKDFESFYRTKMEQFIEVISDKIPERE